MPWNPDVVGICKDCGQRRQKHQLRVMAYGGRKEVCPTSREALYGDSEVTRWLREHAPKELQQPIGATVEGHPGDVSP